MEMEVRSFKILKEIFQPDGENLSNSYPLITALFEHLKTETDRLDFPLRATSFLRRPKLD